MRERRKELFSLRYIMLVFDQEPTLKYQLYKLKFLVPINGISMSLYFSIFGKACAMTKWYYYNIAIADKLSLLTHHTHKYTTEVMSQFHHIHSDRGHRQLQLHYVS